MDAFPFIREVRDLGDEQKLTVLWATDLHYRSEETGRAAVLERLREMTRLTSGLDADLMAVTGDLTDGRDPLDVQKRDLYEVTEALRETAVPALVCEGNHDDNTLYASDEVASTFLLDDALTTSLFHRWALRPLLRDGFVSNPADPAGGYYYRDFPSQRIRVIALNTTDIPYIPDENGHIRYYGQHIKAVRQQQLGWLSDKALHLPGSGWGVVIFSHCCIGCDDYIVDTVFHGREALWTLLRGFAAGTAGTARCEVPDFEAVIPFDFTGQQDTELIACLAGHFHEDVQFYQDGILHVLLTNFENERNGSWDAVVIDWARHLLHTRRWNCPEASRDLPFSPPAN